MMNNQSSVIWLWTFSFPFYTILVHFSHESITFNIYSHPPMLIRSRRKKCDSFPINFTCMLKVMLYMSWDGIQWKTKLCKHNLAKVICHGVLGAVYPSARNPTSARSSHNRSHKRFNEILDRTTRVRPQTVASPHVVSSPLALTMRIRGASFMQTDDDEPWHMKYETPKASWQERIFLITTTFNAESFMCWEMVYSDVISNENFRPLWGLTDWFPSFVASIIANCC